MDKTPLLQAVQIAGGQLHLAKAIGVSQGHLWCWLHRDKRGVPAEKCAAIERAVGGAVTRYDLRPDVFGPAPAQAQAEDRAA